ncbi:MAG TPA: LPD7 domain-containing protein [Tianweitania sediminis]|nr:LPD7 domain-containing protein [Tianweitania sediminis]
MTAIASTRFDEARGCLWIDLSDGSTLIDRGDSIALRGRLTWQAALETAAAAERHGWTEVTVSGDQAYKDAVSVAAMLRGITVTNHHLSRKARAELDRLLDERAAEAERQQSEPSRKSGSRLETAHNQVASHEIHQRITKRRSISGMPMDVPSDGEVPVLNYKPRPARPHRKGANWERTSS